MNSNCEVVTPRPIGGHVKPLLAVHIANPKVVVSSPFGGICVTGPLYPVSCPVGGITSDKPIGGSVNPVWWKV